MDAQLYGSLTGLHNFSLVLRERRATRRSNTGYAENSQVTPQDRRKFALTIKTRRTKTSKRHLNEQQACKTDGKDKLDSVFGVKTR